MAELYYAAQAKLYARLGDRPFSESLQWRQSTLFYVLSLKPNNNTYPDDEVLCAKILELDPEGDTFKAVITAIALADPLKYDEDVHQLRCYLYEMLGITDPVR